MITPRPLERCDRLLVALPNWVGDVVLATPVLAALRAHFLNARITLLLRKYVREIVAGGGWHDDERYWPDRRDGGLRAELNLARQLRDERYDAVLLLTNSFRSGLLAWLARIPRRVGYARDGRTWLLTDRLRPLKQGGAFVPASVLPYYCKIAEQVGCPVTDRRLRLGVTPDEDEAGRALRRHYRLDDGSPYAVINPGAAFGAAKCWPAERFAALCDRIAFELSMKCVLVGAPAEAALMRRIAEKATSPAICCLEPGTTLGSLKPLVRDSALLVCNDTGPRHYGNAFGVPTLTIFGPTHQAWTDTDYAGEIRLQIPVDCGPCQLPVCPLDHRCMTGISVDMVMEIVRRLALPRSVPAAAASAAHGV
jgi:heptosyltransferase-2